MLKYFFLVMISLSLGNAAIAGLVPATATFPVSSAWNDTVKLTKYDSLFNKLQLGKLGLGRRAFDYAIIGYNILKAKNKLQNQDVLSIADMTTLSGKKRFFVIDMKNSKLLFVTYVAHG